MTTKRERRLEIRLDEELYAQARDYAEARGTTLAALVRATLRHLTDPRKPLALPRGIAREVRRAPRGKVNRP
jgi:hypothetical protein